MRYLLLVYAIISSFQIQAQNTYSKTYHLEVGVNNIAQTLIVDGDEFIMATAHSGGTSVVSALTRFDLRGDIISQNSFSDFVVNTSRSSIKTSEGFELAGHRWSLDRNSSRGLELLKINSNLEFTDQIIINSEFERTTNLPGVLDVEGSYKVVYGSFINSGSTTNSGAVISLVDKAMDTIIQEIVFVGDEGEEYRDFSVYGLQETFDNQLIFIVQTRQRNDSVTGFGSYFEIIKFNSAGEVLSRLKHDAASGTNQALGQDEEGGIYFYDQFFPFVIDSTFGFQDQSGSLIKLTPGLDSVNWSFPIHERDMIQASRAHEILGIRQLEDENLLAFGRVGLGMNGENETIGFICKFTKEGEMLWVREYGIPIPEEFVDLELIGVLGTDRIKDCQELADGRLLCIGEHAYGRPDNGAYRELWALMLDEDGCLEPGCDATQILTHISKVATYQEGSVFPNPVSNVLHISDVDFDEFRIYDMIGRQMMTGSFETTIALPASMPSGVHPPAQRK